MAVIGTVSRLALVGGGAPLALLPQLHELEFHLHPQLRTSSGRLRYMISYMISRNNDIAYDIICLELSMIS